MSNVPLWFERQFEFTFPSEAYPNLCVRLRGTPARVEELVCGCGRDVLTRKPEDKWSAQEHAGHLVDLEPLWLKRVEDFVAGGPELSAVDLSNRKTHEANYNAQSLEKILADFRGSRALLVERAEELEPALFSRVLVHPRLKKPMRLVDHLYFVAEHDDHHLARIWELIR
jgi:uncharacterized damage-inducible protein DinB